MCIFGWYNYNENNFVQLVVYFYHKCLELLCKNNKVTKSILKFKFVYFNASMDGGLQTFQYNDRSIFICQWLIVSFQKTCVRNVYFIYYTVHDLHYTTSAKMYRMHFKYFKFTLQHMKVRQDLMFVTSRC